MVQHLRVVILTYLALSIGHVSNAAEFVPLGIGAWETHGRYAPNDDYLIDYVFPLGATPDDAFPDWGDGTKRLPGGTLASPVSVWGQGFSSVMISDNGRVITGRGTSATRPLWFQFTEDGSPAYGLSNNQLNSFDAVTNLDLTANGLKGLASYFGGGVSRNISFGINSGISIPSLSYLQPLPPGLSDWHQTGMSGATAISGDGSVLVGKNVHDTAFRWSNADNRFEVLPDMSTAVDLSYDGSVVVGGPKWWTEATGAQYFGPVPTPEFNYSAEAISADGTAIAGTMTVNGVREAFLWTQAGGFQGLGDLPGGIAESYVTGLSADGLTVIGMSLSDRGSEPFRWNAATGMQSVIDLLTSGGADLQGYDLSTTISPYSTISGVSGDGSVLVGSSGGERAWLARIAIVPEPGAAALALFAMVLTFQCHTTFRK